MAITAPGRVLLQHLPLRFVKTRGSGRKSVDSAILLIPFIDFLIVLVVFLLTTFGASGDLDAQRPGLIMPNAAHVEAIAPAPIIAIDHEVILVDRQRVASTRDLAQTSSLERIEPLVQVLEIQRQNWMVLHPNAPFRGDVILQADRGVDFRVIKKVMFSAAQAQYTNVSFAVNEVE
jgi:biopolymer transport protein ExbD